MDSRSKVYSDSSGHRLTQAYKGCAQAECMNAVMLIMATQGMSELRQAFISTRGRALLASTPRA